MPRHYARARKQARRYNRRRRTGRVRAPRRRAKGLNRKEKKQVRVLAQQAVVRLSEPKRHQYQIGTFHNNPVLYAFGSPTYLQGTSWGGALMVNQAVSIPVGLVSQGGADDERIDLQILLRGIAFQFLISWNPTNIDPGTCIAKLMLVSTTNDPAGGNLSYIGGAAQDAFNHIPSLLCVPADTMGTRYVMDPLNKERSDLDVREYTVHWKRQMTFRADATKTFASRRLKVTQMFKTPKTIEYSSANASSVLGRRYFLLFNSTAEVTTSTQANRASPQLHANIWTFFRDRL